MVSPQTPLPYEKSFSDFFDSLRLTFSGLHDKIKIYKRQNGDSSRGKGTRKWQS